MKTITLALPLVFVAIANGYSQNEIVDLGSLDPVCVYVYDNSCYYVEFGFRKNPGINAYLKLPRDSYHKNEYGYMILDIPEPAYYDGRYLSINGKFWGESFPDTYYSSPEINSDTWYDHYIWAFERYKNEEFKSIGSSKFLEETIGGKKVRYEPLNLFKKLSPSFEREISTTWHNATPPWAEGEDGPGIGAYVEIEYNDPVAWIYIINGYVDLSRQHLFYQNNRVKTMKVEDLENKMEYTLHFQDYVYLHDLVFQKATRHIKLTIQEVYPGTRYDDTCISAIYFRHDSVSKPHWRYPAMTEAELLKNWSALDGASN